jgi:hypothetical protein
MLDMSLDIKHADSIEKALRNFAKPEILSNSNKYKCQRCQKLVNATKSFSIYKDPCVLTLQLKRFNMMGGKMSKPIRFDEKLDLSPFLSQKGRQANYSLYAVLVHSGHSCNSGHYYCFVKSAAGIWYCMNDSSVNQVSVATVLKQNAYMLFYRKDQPSKLNAPSPQTKIPTVKTSAVPQKFSSPHADLSTVISRQTIAEKTKVVPIHKSDVGKNIEKPPVQPEKKVDVKISEEKAKIVKTEKAQSTRKKWQIDSDATLLPLPKEANALKWKVKHDPAVTVKWDDENDDKKKQLEKVMQQEIMRPSERRFTPKKRDKTIYGTQGKLC